MTKRIKTAHLQNIQLWEASGKDWRAMQAERVRALLSRPKPAVSEDSPFVPVKRPKRNGWQSVIKDKRIKNDVVQIRG